MQRLMASFEPGTPLVVSPESAAAHAALMVVDLHCDASWVPRCVPWHLRCRRAAVAEPWRIRATRDLLSRADPSRCGLWRCERSHVDVPRLVAGNVALQVFTAFTQVPSAPHCEGPMPVCDPLPVGNSNASFDSVSALVPFSGAQRRRERAAAAPAQQRMARLSVTLTAAFAAQATRCARCAACWRARCTRRRACAALRRAAAARLRCSRVPLRWTLMWRAAPRACAARAAAPSPRGCWCARRKAGYIGRLGRLMPLLTNAQGVEGAHALEGKLSNLDVMCARTRLAAFACVFLRTDAWS